MALSSLAHIHRKKIVSTSNINIYCATCSVFLHLVVLQEFATLVLSNWWCFLNLHVFSWQTRWEGGNLQVCWEDGLPSSNTSVKEVQKSGWGVHWCLSHQQVSSHHLNTPQSGRENKVAPNVFSSKHTTTHTQTSRCEMGINQSNISEC